MSNGVRYTPTFAMPTEYERAAMEARRRQRMAEMLAQQAYTPQDIGSAPIPRAAPLVQGLQAFLTARQQRKAEEALEKAQAADIAGERELREKLGPRSQIAAPTNTQIAESVGMPQIAEDGTVSYGQTTMPKLGMEQVMPTAQERERTIEEALFSGTPRAQKYAQYLIDKMKEKPAAEEFGTTPVKGADGRYYLVSKAGRTIPTDIGIPKEEMTPYQLAQLGIERERLAWQQSRGGQAAERPKAPSGYRYTDTGDLEPIPGGPQDPNRVRDLPANIVVQISDEQQRGGRFKNAMDQANSFLNMINSGELPLNKLSGAQYATQRALDFAQGQEGDPTEAYVRYYELERFVDQQVNTILSAAKGPQTEGDALRARKQILDNPNNEKIVKSALQDLVRIMSNEVDLSSARVEDLQAPYGRSSKRSNW